MEYERISAGVFRRRLNRFVAEVVVQGVVEICHVKNTGRCKELLLPGARVYVNEALNPRRATKYDLVAVWKGDRLINMDSQSPNLVFGEYLKQGRYVSDVTAIKPETKYGNSRFDFYFEAAGQKTFAEVKGVTLEENNVALFPDAPTERGVKHLRELTRCVAEGYAAHAVFIIQLQGVSHFTPNHRLHPEFGQALTEAQKAGVNIAAFDCAVKANSIIINDCIPVNIGNAK